MLFCFVANPSFAGAVDTAHYIATMSVIANHVRSAWSDKQTHVVMFSATAIALYGYDQGVYVVAVLMFPLLTMDKE